MAARRGAPAHPIAPLHSDGSGKVAVHRPFQISWAYSRMVRSDENHGIRATFRIEAAPCRDHLPAGVDAALRLVIGIESALTM